MWFLCISYSYFLCILITYDYDLTLNIQTVNCLLKKFEKIKQTTTTTATSTYTIALDCLANPKMLIFSIVAI